MDKRVSDIIEIAIKREEDAYDFYMDIHSKVGDPGVKDTLEFIAGEEKKHKAFLVSYRDGKFGEKALRMSAVVDYKIAEYLEEPEVAENMKPRMYIWWPPTGNRDLICSIRSWRICMQVVSRRKCC